MINYLTSHALGVETDNLMCSTESHVFKKIVLTNKAYIFLPMASDFLKVTCNRNFVSKQLYYFILI